MKKILISFLLLVGCLLAQTKNKMFMWNPNPVEDKVSYYILLGSFEPNILRYNEETQEYYYNYDYMTISHGCHAWRYNLDITRPSYYVLIAYSHYYQNYSWPTNEIVYDKSTSGKFKNTYSLVPPTDEDPLMYLKYGIVGNNGSSFAVESSTDLINWNLEFVNIISNNGLYEAFFPVDAPRKFFRTIGVNRYNYQQYDPNYFYWVFNAPPSNWEDPPIEETETLERYIPYIPDEPEEIKKPRRKERPDKKNKLDRRKNKNGNK